MLDGREPGGTFDMAFCYFRSTYDHSGHEKQARDITLTLGKTASPQSA